MPACLFYRRYSMHHAYISNIKEKSLLLCLFALLPAYCTAYSTYSTAVQYSSTAAATGCTVRRSYEYSSQQSAVVPHQEDVDDVIMSCCCLLTLRMNVCAG